MRSWFQIKVRRVLGRDPEHDKEVTVLGRMARWTPKGIEFEDAPTHGHMVLDHVGFQAGTRSSATVVDKGF